MPTSLYIFIVVQLALDVLFSRAILTLIKQDMKLLDLIGLSQRVSELTAKMLKSKTPKK